MIARKTGRRRPGIGIAFVVALGGIVALEAGAYSRADSLDPSPPVPAGGTPASEPAPAPAPAQPEAASHNVAADAPAALSHLQPGDPWRRFNRRAFAVNRVLDRVLIGPVAHAYARVIPAPVRRGVGRVLDNLREPVTALNDLAQAHPGRAIKAAARFVTNSTVGVLGVFDVASSAGLEKHRSDFGQTLGRYGVGAGPYLYLPVIGPMNLRDGLGSVVNTVIDPLALVSGGSGNAVRAAHIVATGLDDRTSADGTLRSIDQEATDPYAATRSVYSQYRAAVVREATGEAETLPDFDSPPAAVPEGRQAAGTIETPVAVAASAAVPAQDAAIDAKPLPPVDAPPSAAAVP